MIWVSLPFATFGLVVKAGVVVEAPPIAKWCEGKTARWAWDYWVGRGADVRWVVIEEYR